MKIENESFYSGPNIWHPSSGLLLVVNHEAADEQRLAWKPDPAEALDVLVLVRRALRVAGEPAGLMPRPIATAASPLFELLLATTHYLTGDFCLQPQAGRVLAVRKGRMHIFQPCDDRAVGSGAWNLALEAVQRLLPASEREPAAVKLLRESYWTYRRAARAHGLNQTTIALAREAVRRGIPVQRLAAASQFLQLGQGCNRQRINETSTDRTSGVARWLSKDKFATAALLATHGLPTTMPVAVGTADAAVRAWRLLAGPAVVKPRASGKGQGVTVGAATEDEVRLAFSKAQALKAGGVIVERMVRGEDYRLLVVDGRLIAAGKRLPAHVVGDGQQTVGQLVKEVNRDPGRGQPFERLLEFIVLDDEAHAHLAASGLTLESVPEAGRTVRLCGAANMSRGGTAVDVTQSVHPDNRLMAERAARLVGVDIVGIDFLSPDIAQSWRESSAAILEVNATPGLRVHMAGNPAQNIAAPMLDMLFPGGSNGRIPTVGITGSVGKTTTTRLVAAILTRHGLTVGMCTTQGSYVGSERVRDIDSAGGRSANRVLQDPRVQAGAFELARGGLVKFGMALDALDVGVVLNIHDNHLGIDGAKDREDLARIKRLVVQAARRLAVLNADEPLCLAMRAHVRAPVCLLTEDAGNPEVAKHIEAGGVAAILDGRGERGVLRLVEGARLVGEIAASDIPAAWGGAYRPGLVTAMAAAAAAHGLGVPFDTIRATLCDFQSTERANPGRMNFIENLPFRLLVTWIDGAEPMRELSRFAGSIEVTGRKRLMVCAVGNRSDEFLVNMGGAAAGGFDHYVVSDWTDDLRGRKAGIVAGLLARGLQAKDVPSEQISIASDHDEALQLAFNGTEPGDLLVVATYISPEARRKIGALANLAHEP